ncbi:MAG: MFS transporter [Firmicutes bacterium]|nr:MFS transporter [Bacillota bacterium]
MEDKTMKKLCLRIETTYALATTMYWAMACTIQGFTSVFLAYRGLTDGQIGVTVSCISVLGILLQLVISNFCDHHPKLALKRIIAMINIWTSFFVGIMRFSVLPPLAVAVLFILAEAPQRVNTGLLNALFMQYNNAGIPARFGWPRGVGSLGWALGAFFFGRIIADRTPDTLLTMFLFFAVFSIGSVLMMPGSGNSEQKLKTKEIPTSYKDMLLGNRTLRLFLIALMFLGIGQVSISTFLNRIVESLGGGTAEQGIAILIQSGMELPMMVFSPVLLRRFKAGTLVAFCMFSYTVRTVLLMLCGSLTALYGIMAFGLICYGIYGFAAILFVNDIVDVDQKVRAQSLISLCFTGGIGGVVGNIAGGAIIEAFGITWVYVFSAAFSLIGLGFMLLSLRSWKKQLRSKTY